MVEWRLSAGDLDDARLMQQPVLRSGGIRRRAHKQHAAVLSLPDQIAEQGIVGTGEAQIDHLSVRVECRRERARQRE